MKGYEYKGHTKLNSTHFSDLVGPFCRVQQKIINYWMWSYLGGVHTLCTVGVPAVLVCI